MPSEPTLSETPARPDTPPAGNPASVSLWDRVKPLTRNQTTMLLLVFVAMIAFFSAINPRFFSTAAFGNILQDWAPIMLLAVGQTFVIISGGIDLSVGSTLGLSGIACALTMRALNGGGQSATVCILAGLVVGALVGLAVGAVNAFLVTKVRLAPFIATLATMGAAAGFTLVVTGGTQIAEGPKEVILIGSTTYLSLFTVPVLVVILVTAIASVYLHRSRFGRWTYAIGSNGFAARGAGINVQRHLVKLYVLCGLTAGLAGVLVYFRLGSGSPTSGTGNELTAIAAVVIGGTSLTGGLGRMTGTVVGALIITSVLSGLIIIGVEPNWQQVVVGGLIALAVGIQGIGSSVRRQV
ncbi:ABC transporter permease [Pseudonocardia spinosispora]|uniref:ABC transporter permease n=1 Tax=Pseudonocardia spinosispora TaxID=103441 RepID=UPI000420F793|nr:ABC transporter permease [Pseudonocardia spinosispora]